jgi:uncharacterized RDD family membrane protein YckC
MSDQTGNPQQPDEPTPPAQSQGGAYGTGATPPPPPPPAQGAGQPAAPSRTGGVGQPADLGPRFVARLIDFVLLGIVNAIVVSALVVGTLMGTNAAVVGGWGLGTGTTWAANAVTTISTTVLTLAYFVLMEHYFGQTVGKMLLKLKTQGPGGGNPSIEQALRRNAFTAIGILGIIPYVGFLGSLLSLAAVITIMVTINNDNTARHGWHDNFAGGTTVVRVG